MLKRIGILLLCLGFSLPAYAAPDPYIEGEWPDFLHTLIRFNALDLNDDRLVDEYAAITECDLYKFYYSDDFRWNQVRNAMRQSTEMKIANYPGRYKYVVRLQLDRYDFKEKIFKFATKSIIHNVNSFMLFQVDVPVCNIGRVKYIPTSYRAVADTRLTMDGLPLEPAVAESLLQNMNADGNTDRIVWMRIDMTVAFVDKLHKSITDAGMANEYVRYSQTDDPDNRIVRMDVRLDKVSSSKTRKWQR